MVDKKLGRGSNVQVQRKDVLRKKLNVNEGQ